MKLSKLTRLILIGVFLGIGCTIAGDFDKRIDRQFRVKKGGTLRLESDRGSVKVSSFPSEEVRIDITMTANTGSSNRAEEWFDAFELKFDHNGDDVEVLGKWRDNWFNRKSRLRIVYDIKVPETYNLDIATSGGSISVADLTGVVDVRTSGGSIDVGQIEGQVTAKTSGGSISVQRAKGQTTAKTSGGSIRLGEIAGPVEAKTSGGGINVDEVVGHLMAHTSGGSLRLKNLNGSVDAKTSGGSIHAELLRQIDKPMELRTSGGGIMLTVPADFKADLDAATSGGRVKTDLPVSVKGTMRKNSLRGQINGGGPEVMLRTSGGNIEIRAQ